jgi:acyl-CoA synthetase (NDP forming)
LEKNPKRKIDLEPFFKARSVAILGASPDFYSPSGRPIKMLLELGYEGKVYPVNPKYREIAGLKCYPTVFEIPDPVDLAVIAVAAPAVIPLLRDCASQGIKGAVVIASGFGEVGQEGLLLEKEMAALAQETGMRIMGPNCLGMVNNINKLWAGFAELQKYGEEYYRYPNRFSLISQSGFFGSVICSMAALQRVGFNHFASIGNQADLSFTDFLEYMVDDPQVQIITGYIEGLKQGPRFMEMARKALIREKPMIVMKVGRTEAGARAASSHTGSLAGSDRVYDAAFRQAGIIRAEGFGQLIAAITFAAGGRWPRGNRVAIVSSAGGASVIMSDQCSRMGLEVTALDPETRRSLDRVLPFFASSANPVDLTAQVMTEPDLLYKCLKLVIFDPNVDLVIANLLVNREDVAKQLGEQLRELYNQIDKPVLINGNPWGRNEVEAILMEQLTATGYPAIEDIDTAVWAAASLVRWFARTKNVLEKPYNPAPGRARDRTKSILEACRDRYLAEHRAMEVLKSYGINVCRSALAGSEEEAVALAAEIGYPVVLKIQSPDILHKSDIGGVKVNLDEADEVRRAYSAIKQAVEQNAPDARIEGILVQEMLTPGTEAIVGVNYDKVFGPVIMFGLGGIFVEALADVSFRVAPLSRSDAREMIREIKGFRVLEGLRGAPPADLEALEEVLLNVSRLAVEMSSEIAEVDINPLFVYPAGQKAIAADALITLRNR